ncbi:MAG TPA: MarR family winged helix-turn-helix transcriptional regulator [Novosphingobium sp.]|nr:MarR family winged helix-turn-helix transcriptional regulator [Novosphingobium sp.]
MLPSDRAPRADQCNCFSVRKAARQITRFYDAHLQPTGLRITQFLTLAILNEVPDAAIIDLADRLDIEPTAMGKMVSTLERDHMVEVRRSAADGRSRIVQMTAQGRRLFESAVPLWQEAQQKFEEFNGTQSMNALRPGFSFPVAGGKAAT